jgi:DNA-directed RNA polymerase sigma subunit (sigma70/sigma32)
MVALIPQHTAPQRQERARKCKTHMRKMQFVTEPLPARPGLKNGPDPKNEWVEAGAEPLSEAQTKRSAFKSGKAEAPVFEAGVAVEAPTGGLRFQERPAFTGDKVIKLYLREVGQVKLLTPREEMELVARVKQGDRKARERLIKANLRLVVGVSREYEDMGLPLLDLISEGNLGLLKAVERFDPANGSTFSAYSIWWIKRSIKRALTSQSRTLPQPT